MDWVLSSLSGGEEFSVGDVAACEVLSGGFVRDAVRGAAATAVKDRSATAHSLFVPLHYEQNYAYPLLVWLHGSGDSEAQLQRVMPLISMRNYAAVAPRGTEICGTPDRFGKQFDWSQQGPCIAEAEQRVLRCIEIAAARLNVHRRRVFLAGCGSGGTMAFRLAASMPGEFAGVLSFGGEFPKCSCPLSQLDDFRHLSVFLAHGRDAARYTTDHACDDLRLFHIAGLSVTLRQYPCGDELDPQMLLDADSWIMEQITGVESSRLQESSAYSDLN